MVMQNNSRLTQEFQKVSFQGRTSRVVLYNAIELLRFNLFTIRKSEFFKNLASIINII